MPKVAQHRALARQWEILKRLPARGPGITSRELVESLDRAGFQITKRTVERDLTELSMLFGIACNDGSVPYGWYWVRGECPDLPGVTLADALSLNMIEATLRPMLPPSALEALEQRFKIARRKLTELSQDNPNARWASKVSYVQPTMPLIPPIIPEGVLEAVQEALLQERQLRISYRARGGSRATDQIVHPVGFVQRGPISYLVATAFDYDDKRLYAIHRIKSAEIRMESARPRTETEFADYLNKNALHFGNNQLIKLVALVDRPLADILEETRLAEDQLLDATDQGVRVTATVYDSWQLRWWLLSQGAAITVQSPDALRNGIEQTLRKMLKNYAEATLSKSAD